MKGAGREKDKQIHNGDIETSYNGNDGSSEEDSKEEDYLRILKVTCLIV